MKRILLCILCTLYALTGYSQKPRLIASSSRRTIDSTGNYITVDSNEYAYVRNNGAFNIPLGKTLYDTLKHVLFNGGATMYYDQKVRTYTSYDSMTMDQTGLWDDASKQWFPLQRTFYTYYIGPMAVHILEKKTEQYDIVRTTWYKNDSTRYLYTDDRIDSAITMTWVNYASFPSNNRKQIYSYNAGGRLLSNIEYKWYNNNWVKTYGLVHIYNMNTDSMLSFNSTGTYYSMIINQEDARNNDTFTEIYDWINNDYRLNKLISTNYDALNRKTHIRIEFKDTLIYSHWLRYLDIDSQLHYLNNGMIDTILEKRHDTSGQWVNSLLRSYTYTANQNLDTSVLKSYDVTNNQWINSSLTNYTYIANKDPKRISYNSWIDSTSQWQETASTTYSYNSYDQTTSIININTRGPGSDGTFYYYEPFPVTVTQTASKKPITIFPNPANDVLRCTIPVTGVYQLKITDITGRIIAKYEGNNTGQDINIPVRSLATGNYQISIDCSNNSFSGSFIKN